MTQFDPKDIRPLYPYKPTKCEAKVLIEHLYDKWDKAYGSRFEEDYHLAYYDYKAYKDQMYERRKHANFLALSPAYAHYVCIKATRYCRIVRM